ncbi:hypothetical protein Tco_0455425 [Tanacetum coccineum]
MSEAETTLPASSITALRSIIKKDRHLLSFHDAQDAKSLWAAIKARFLTRIGSLHARECKFAIQAKQEQMEVRKKRISPIEDSTQKPLVSKRPTKTMWILDKMDLECLTGAKKLYNAPVALSLYGYEAQPTLLTQRNLRLVDETLCFSETPRKNDVYSLNLKNTFLQEVVIPCLIAKASEDDSAICGEAQTKRAYVNFKISTNG